MGKKTGFIDYSRKNFSYLPVQERVKNFKEFLKIQPKTEVQNQAARCMDCGTPYCSWACPVDNKIPEFNDFVYRGLWQKAYYNLISTNNFPEFTGRICPAPCEPACCTVLVNSAVTIKQIELAIIEKAYSEGWVEIHKIKKRTAVKIAVVGSGPAGLAAAQQLNLGGHRVTVFEKNEKLGGLLRYGIPDFKLEKWVIDRRIDLLKKEGIEFITNSHVGNTTSIKKIQKEFDYLCLCLGAEEQRGIAYNKNTSGIHFAMEFLTQQNRAIQGVVIKPVGAAETRMDAKDKHIIVLGGGDTGSDCIGTGIRQKCASMTQIQIHKELPLGRYETNPWPLWPRTISISDSQEEGCKRLYSLLLKEIKTKKTGEGEKIEKVIFQKIQWPSGEIKSGQRNYKVLDEEVTLPCDLLLIALGFQHCVHGGLLSQLNLKFNERKNIAVDSEFRSSQKKIFAAGDVVEGANLVVTAIASGRKMAAALQNKITNSTSDKMKSKVKLQSF